MIEAFFRTIIKEVAAEAAREVVKYYASGSTFALAGTEAANDAEQPVKKTDAIAMDANELRDECLSLIGKLAPTHGPQLRALFAEFGAKRLSEIDDPQLPKVLERLEALKNAG